MDGTDGLTCVQVASPSPLPVSYFFTAVLFYVLMQIRKGGLTIGQALLVLIGLRKPERAAWSVISWMVVAIPTLALFYWLFEDCKASLP